MRYMEEVELDRWKEIMRRCGVFKHPTKLNETDKAIQEHILFAMSDNANNLPDDQQLETWFNWHWAR